MWFITSLDEDETNLIELGISCDLIVRYKNELIYAETPYNHEKLLISTITVN